MTTLVDFRAIRAGQVADAPRAVVGPQTRQRERWPRYLAAAAFALYVGVAWHMIYGVNYEIGDAVARTAAAQHVVLSRDPHLAALGFYWMPLPTLSQIPAMLLLAPWGDVRFAGPLTSALWAAASILVLAAIGRRNGAPRNLTVLLCTVYAVSPVVVWAASDGMSEASSFFFLVLVVYAYSVWRRDRRPADLVLLAVALAGEMACRYEAIPLAIAVAATVAVTLPRRQWTRTLVLIGLPAAYVFILWLGTSYIIVGDAFYWLKTLNAIAKASGSGAAIFATTGSRPANVAGFVLGFTVLFASLLWVLVPLCWRGSWRSTVRTLGLLVPGFVFPVVLATQMLRGNAPGAARYFYPCWVVAVAAALALGGDLRAGRRFVNPQLLLVVVAPLAAFVQLLAFANPRVANVEHEDALFAPLVGRPGPELSGRGLLADDFGQWQELFAAADPMLAAGGHLMLDTDSAPQAVLFTSHPGRLVIPEDRDFEPILAAPGGRVNLVALPRSTDSRQASSRYLPAIAALVSDPAGGWQKIGSYGHLELYQATGYELSG